MVKTLPEPDSAARRRKILLAARWCFLNFGYAKTSFEDIAKRASLSRTLLYRIFKDKEDVFQAVFADWLVSRQPDAMKAASGPGNALGRLITVSKLLVVEPWSDMAGAAMATEFYEVCERLDPETSAQHRRVVIDCVTTILDDAAAAEVFVLALDGLLIDEPTVTILQQRVELLADRFARETRRRKADSSA